MQSKARSLFELNRRRLALWERYYATDAAGDETKAKRLFDKILEVTEQMFEPPIRSHADAAALADVGEHIAGIESACECDPEISQRALKNIEGAFQRLRGYLTHAAGQTACGPGAA